MNKKRDIDLVNSLKQSYSPPTLEIAELKKKDVVLQSDGDHFVGADDVWAK